MPRIAFWYDPASTYSYLAAMRVDDIAAKAGVEVAWRPFLLGPIFKAQGWETSPFNLFPAKGRHMVRDLERTAAARGLAFRMPSPFPANSVKAARIALLGEEEGWTPAFSRAVFAAEFGRGENIAEDAVLGATLAEAGLDAERILPAVAQQEIKDRLRRRVAEAQALGLFGAPTFITEDGEIFWGDDRLEQALAWACGQR